MVQHRFLRFCFTMLSVMNSEASTTLHRPTTYFGAASEGMAGWVSPCDLRFYILFNSISVISGRWAGDNERLCAMEP